MWAVGLVELVSPAAPRRRARALLAALLAVLARGAGGSLLASDAQLSLLPAEAPNDALDCAIVSEPRQKGCAATVTLPVTIVLGFREAVVPVVALVSASERVQASIMPNLGMPDGAAPLQAQGDLETLEERGVFTDDWMSGGGSRHWFLRLARPDDADAGDAGDVDDAADADGADGSADGGADGADADGADADDPDSSANGNTDGSSADDEEEGAEDQGEVQIHKVYIAFSTPSEVRAAQEQIDNELAGAQLPAGQMMQVAGLAAVTALLLFVGQAYRRQLQRRKRAGGSGGGHGTELSRVPGSEEAAVDLELSREAIPPPVSTSATEMRRRGPSWRSAQQVVESFSDQSAAATQEASPTAAAPAPQLPLHQQHEGLEARAKAAFEQRPALGAESFTQRWQATEQLEVWGATLSRDLPEDKEFIALLQRGHVQCLASGQVRGIRKFYFYAVRRRRSGDAGMPMAELSLAVATRRLSCVFKDAQPEGLMAAFVKSTIQAFL